MVPWIDETTTDFMQPNNADIWPKIEADFKAAYDNLPETQGDAGRANKWAAGAYLAKVYLYQKHLTILPFYPVFLNLLNFWGDILISAAYICASK